MLSHIHFQTLPVIDFDRAIAFYRDMLGLKVERDAPYGDSRWVFMAIPGAQTLLHLDPVAVVPPHDKPRLVFVTTDVDATCDTLRERGVVIDKGPEDAPWEPGTRWAILHDTEGNMILLQTVKETTWQI